MSRPMALDLFCGAGGASMGLYRAGFDVVGVDIKPQPRYPFPFIRGDALTVDAEGFDFIWASPPCQAFSPLRSLNGRRQYPNLIPDTRALLAKSGVPYAIENVEGAEQALVGDNLTLLCGSMFGLQVPDGSAELRRHRIFETSFSIALKPQCQHGGVESLSVTGRGLDGNRHRWLARMAISVVGHSAPCFHRSRRRAISVTGATAQTNVVTNRIRKTFSIGEARAAMGIDWMPMSSLSQAVPPVYAEFIGRQALEVLTRESSRRLA
jgi:DNA (cytosine-5)-methyltransferase 1